MLDELKELVESHTETIDFGEKVVPLHIISRFIEEHRQEYDDMYEKAWMYEDLG